MEEQRVDELYCYIHAMSPMKNAQSSNRKYFDCTLQNKDTTVQAVCYSREKYSELNSLLKTGSPVEITNYNTSAVTNGKEDIIILSKTRISPITSIEIDFSWIMCILCTLDQHIDRHSTDVSVDISAECRSICRSMYRPTYRSSIGRYVY